MPLSEMSTSKAWTLMKSQVPAICEKYFPGAVTHNALKDVIDQTMLLLALEECVKLI